MGSGESLGPYRLLEALGQGGMGVVYRGRHAVSERAVAIKTVRVAAPRWIESIRREIHALTRIRHPGIVRIIDHGVQEGRPWYAMDLLEGESLRDFGVRIWSAFRRDSILPGQTCSISATVQLSQQDSDPVGLGALVAPSSTRFVGQPPAAAGSLRQVLWLMRRLCATLAFLHGEGFVSCDLKPENVLLVGAAPVLIDFGLSARFPAATGREAIDAQRTTAGTLQYMSPEQLRGQLVDARSDLYAVGCILYELITGAPPFSGPPLSIREQHLSAAPPRPSRLVRDLPEALENLVLRLLAKSPSDRVGFADDVAAALADIGGDTERLRDFPPARPYLYRPRFAGRTEMLATLTSLRDRASAGQGGMALIGGESGIGKTRLALELMRLSPAAGMRIIASESVKVAPDQGATVASAPLHAIRPLLRAIADRCQEGGAETTDRLLAMRRSVLAQYEPLLVDVPALDPLQPVIPLSPEAARQRLLLYLAQTLTAFAQEQPVLWVLDDLGWADDLSLAFLKLLSREYFTETPAFLLGMYRSEEANDDLLTLAAQPHVVHLALPELDARDVAQMVADMLALSGEDTGFSAYVAGAAEGNPFFVTEHVRTAVAERLFYRDKDQAWRMRSAATESHLSYEGLPLPRSLRELIEHRLQALSPVAQESAVAAAVLGRETETDLVVEVAGLSPEAAAVAIDELIRRHIIEQRGPARIRFAHDKLREVAYAAPADKLRGLHARAAAALERRFRDRSRAAETWAAIGHHFAEAGQSGAAAEFLKRAGDHSMRSFANADAIVLYRRAISQALLAVSTLPMPADSPSDRNAQNSQAMLLELHEALGDVLALGGRREEARAEYAEAVRLVQQGDSLSLSRFYRKMGKTWEVEHRHDEALRLYRAGRAALPGPVADGPRAREWLQACLDELWVHYWLAHSQEMESLVREVHPVAEKHGTPQQLAGLCQCQIFHHLRRDRYEIADETLALSEMVIRTSGVEGAPDRPWAYFQRGFLLLWRAKPEEAEEDLSLALQLADRAGDVVNQARAALYLAVAARMRNLEDEVLTRSERASKLADAAGMREYIAGVQAMKAWIRVRQGDLDAALASSDEALSGWSTYGGVYPFLWLALLPRIEAHLGKGQLAQAMESCRSLLASDQQRLPSVVERALLNAVSFWGQGDADPAEARHNLEAALAVLRVHCFL